MNEPSEFGRFLKEVRKEHNFNQEELAKSIGKTAQYISNIEKGKNNAPPNDSDIEKLIKKLELNDFKIQEFRKKAAADRNRLPKDQMEYLLKNDNLQSLIKYGMDNNYTNDIWKKLLNYISKKYYNIKRQEK